MVDSFLIRLSRNRTYDVILSKEMTKPECRTYYRILRLLRDEFPHQPLPSIIGLKLITLFRIMREEEQSPRDVEGGTIQMTNQKQEPTKKPEAHSPLPLKVNYEEIPQRGGHTLESWEVVDADGNRVILWGDLGNDIDGAWVPLIVRRVNSGPYVDRKLELADELAKKVIEICKKYPECILTPKGYEVLVGLARQYQAMREETKP